jgi:hypothetical protein
LIHLSLVGSEEFVLAFDRVSESLNLDSEVVEKHLLAVFLTDAEAIRLLSREIGSFFMRHSRVGGVGKPTRTGPA